MATTLALAMRASMSAGGVTSGSNEAAKALDKFGRQARQTANDVSMIKNIAIGAAVAKGIGMAANAFMSAGRSALGFAADVSASVDSLNDLSQRTGIGVESLQALQFAAKLSGVDDITTAVQKLAVAIGQAGESGNTEAFTRLGLEFEQLRAMSPEDQFTAIQAAISALPTEAERAAAAVAIFGRSGVELLPLMSQNIAEVEERMRGLGAIVGADQVDAIASMNDALDMVNATMTGIAGNVLGNLAPVVESLANDLLAFVEQFNAAGGEGGGVADVISNALLDVADYLAGIFDNAMAGFDEFGLSLAEVGAVFDFVANAFTAVMEGLRAIFNAFEAGANVLLVGLGAFLEGLGSWVSSDLESVGKTLKENASAAADKNTKEMADAAGNAASAAGRAVFGEDASQQTTGPAGRAVQKARERMNNPEAKAQRQREREQQAADKNAAREAAAAADKKQKDEEKAAKEAKAAAEKAAKEAEAEAKRIENAKKKRAQEISNAEENVASASEYKAENERQLGMKSNEALQGNDIRSSEGMAQYLALATGREDPALEENRKQTAKLNEAVAALKALQQAPIEILGAAA